MIRTLNLCDSGIYNYNSAKAGGVIRPSMHHLLCQSWQQITGENTQTHTHT